MTPEASLQTTVVATPKRAGIAKRMGLKKGIPDLIVYFPRKPVSPGIKSPIGPAKVLHIELKTKTGLVSDEQYKTLDWLNANGLPAVLCRSFEEAKEAVLNMMRVGRPWV